MMMLPVVTAGLVGLAQTAHANQWTERTVLTFSNPVIIPGETLQQGTYVFKLADATSSRHLVQVLSEDGQKLITTAQAVPTKRAEAKGDVVLRFNPTDRGTPPALKAWFYPGSIYGHEFIYPEQQAREIAQRSKTLVLSTDIPGSDMQKGTLRTIDPAGVRAEWKADEATTREWDSWQRTRSSRTTASTEGNRSSASMVEGDFQAQRVKLDDLESNPGKYLGRTISVDAEVEEIFGPRLFTIDEHNWGDLDGEILVYVPTALAALVRDDDRLTITGMVKPFLRAEVEREWGWMTLDPEVEVELKEKPVLVASQIVGGDSQVVLMIDTTPADDRSVGTSGSSGDQLLTNLADIAGGGEELIGRRVTLTNVRVTSDARGGGFIVGGNQRSVFVLAPNATASGGTTLNVEGVVLQMPDAMQDRLNLPDNANDDIYIVATKTGQ
jgi:hypothetical protein